MGEAGCTLLSLLKRKPAFAVADVTNTGPFAVWACSVRICHEDLQSCPARVKLMSSRGEAAKSLQEIRATIHFWQQGQ